MCMDHNNYLFYYVDVPQQNNPEGSKYIIMLYLAIIAFFILLSFVF